MELFKGLIGAAIRYEPAYFMTTTIKGIIFDSESATLIKMVDNSSRRW